MAWKNLDSVLSTWVLAHPKGTKGIAEEVGCSPATLYASVHRRKPAIPPTVKPKVQSLLNISRNGFSSPPPPLVGRIRNGEDIGTRLTTDEPGGTIDLTCKVNLLIFGNAEARARGVHAPVAQAKDGAKNKNATRSAAPSGELATADLESNQLQHIQTTAALIDIALNGESQTWIAHGRPNEVQQLLNTLHTQATDSARPLPYITLEPGLEREINKLSDQPDLLERLRQLTEPFLRPSSSVREGEIRRSRDLPNFRAELISLLKNARARDANGSRAGAGAQERVPSGEDVAHEIAAIYDLEARTSVSRNLETAWSGRTQDHQQTEVDIQTAKDLFKLRINESTNNRHLILARLSSSRRVTTYEIVFEGPLSMIAGTSNREIELSPEDARSLNVSVPPDKRLVFRRAR